MTSRKSPRHADAAPRTASSLQRGNHRASLLPGARRSDLPDVFARYWFGEHPWEDPQACWRRPPISLACEIETPTLVLVGTEDHRTPLSEAEQLYQALQLRGDPAALLPIPGASHGGFGLRRTSLGFGRRSPGSRHRPSAVGGAEGR
jgi:pimeloyl-ACP methyl ester carboxylesterase